MLDMCRNTPGERRPQRFPNHLGEVEIYLLKRILTNRPSRLLWVDFWALLRSSPRYGKSRVHKSFG